MKPQRHNEHKSYHLVSQLSQIHTHIQPGKHPSHFSSICTKPRLSTGSYAGRLDVSPCSSRFETRAARLDEHQRQMVQISWINPKANAVRPANSTVCLRAGGEARYALQYISILVCWPHRSRVSHGTSVKTAMHQIRYAEQLKKKHEKKDLLRHS